MVRFEWGGFCICWRVSDMKTNGFKKDALRASVWGSLF